MCAGIHPNPGPSGSTQYKTFIQHNCNGIHSSRAELQTFLVNYQVKIAALQETKLYDRSKTPVFQGYNLIRKDRPTGRGGGLAFLVHDSVRYTDLDVTALIPPGDVTLELQGISAYINGSYIKIFNIYIPPSSASTHYAPNLKNILEVDDDALILGDLNAHSEAWFSSLSDVRGDSLVGQFEDSNFYILNTNSHTRRPTNGNTSSPDVSLISSHLALSVEWETHVALNSDHLPISITFIDDLPPLRTSKTFINFKRAKWGHFTSETERVFADLPRPASCSAGEKVFRRVLLKASRRHIPAGFRKDFMPGMSRESIELTKERDRLRVANPLDPEIPRLNQLIKDTVNDDRKRLWREKVESSRPSTNPDKHWRLLRLISGKRQHQATNQPIFFGAKCYSKPQAIAGKFCQQFASVGVHKTDRNSRLIDKKLKMKHPLDHTFSPFLPAATRDAIDKSATSTALGPDGLTSLHLKHLGPSGISYLTDLYNLSLSHADIPAVWKKANIVPIPKPGKPANVSKSYRPISLLSPAVKVLERLLLPSINEALPCSPFQHGYRPMRSTVTALLPLATKIAIGFNEKKPASRTATVSLDISKAFDAISHDLLLEKISGTTLHSNIIRWLLSYLRGRTAVCLFQGVTSSQRTCHSGVPQGSVLSPHLFNFFISDFPDLAQLNFIYADDIDIAESSPDITTLGPTLTEHLKVISKWASDKKLVIAPEKSFVTVYTPFNREANYNPNVLIDNIQVPVERKPKFLGLNSQNFFKSSAYTPQAAVVYAKLGKGVQLLKAISGQDWGDKETLRLTFNAYLKPNILYVAPVWFPSIGPEAACIKKLQCVHNNAMRVITGAHQMADTDHLLAETDMLPVDEQLGLACKQFLASAHRRDHPSHSVVKLHSGVRPNRKDIIHTLQSRYLDTIEPFLNEDGVLPKIAYKRCINGIHTSVVSSCKQKLVNKVLGTVPPDIDPSESTLPRRSRTTLTQLRSLHCNNLKSYQAKIGTSQDDICPICREAPHTTRHLFECPAAPTNLSVLDLWKKPQEAADFLRTLPDFNHLPVNPPLPPPPPEPPPAARGGLV